MPGRNELCDCGSGIKYKKCHGENAVKGGAPGAPVRLNITHDDRREARGLQNQLLFALASARDKHQEEEERLIRIAHRRHQFG